MAEITKMEVGAMLRKQLEESGQTEIRPTYSKVCPAPRDPSDVLESLHSKIAALRSFAYLARCQHALAWRVGSRNRIRSWQVSPAARPSSGC